jgi:hypothetical protein
MPPSIADARAELCTHAAAQKLFAADCFDFERSSVVQQPALSRATGRPSASHGFATKR